MSFEPHPLLGQPLREALKALDACGKRDVRVLWTAAPPRKNAADDPRCEAGEQQGAASTRVVGVRDDGDTLIVSRFLTGNPKEPSLPNSSDISGF